jgi:hypothetical protein
MQYESDEEFTDEEIETAKQYARNILDDFLEELETEHDADARAGAILAYGWYIAALNLMRWWRLAEDRLALKELSDLEPLDRGEMN